jgi:hypothetical protein
MDLTGSLHGVECQVFLNGKLVDTINHASDGFNVRQKSYSLILGPEHLEQLQPGRNVLAIRFERNENPPHAWFSLEQVFEKQK